MKKFETILRICIELKNIVINTVESIAKLIDNTDCYNSILSRMNSETKVYKINNLDLNIQ